MKLAIDFDDVIHNPHNIKPGYKMGAPIENAVESMRELLNDGNTIIIHTIWADSPQKRKAISDWLEYFGIQVHGITSIKPDADIYLDNKGLRFINWEQSLNDIRGLK